MNTYSEQLFPEGSLVDCNYVQAKPYGTSYGDLKVWVGKLMPQIPMGLAKEVPAGNDTPTVNASECKVKAAAKVTTRNYFVAKAPNTPYKHSILDFGAALKAVVRYQDGNLDLKLVSEELDPSRDP